MDLYNETEAFYNFYFLKYLQNNQTPAPTPFLGGSSFPVVHNSNIFNAALG
ncbi:hypothetical protein Hanom_Chr14g01312381 [Helianthus anomalus]